jgi:predicted xylan-binding protein with Ca-dependent carbohydrate-binding module
MAWRKLNRKLVPLVKLSVKKTERRLSVAHVLIFVILFAAIGSFLLYSSFASTAVVATLDGSQMTLPTGAKVKSNANADNGKEVEFTAPGTASASVTIATGASVSSIAVSARGVDCNGYPQFSLDIDGSAVMTLTQITSSTWSTYSANVSLTSGTHTVDFITGNHAGQAYGSCNRNLYLNDIVFNGTLPSQSPTVALSATPTSVSSGGSSTLTWSSTNATSCTASGAWSGTKATSGSVSTGALSTGSTYNLSCTGAGGSASASVTVSITSSSNGSPGLVLIWGNGHEDSTVQSDTWLHAGQVVYNWNTAEPTSGSFPQWTGSNNNLNSELKAYYNAGKTTTIQVNADKMPSWLVNTNSTATTAGNGLVANCGYFGLHYTSTTVLIPDYWSTSAADGMNPAFETAMKTMLNSLASAINSSPYKSAVLGIRTGYDLVGTEHYSLGENNMHVNAPAPSNCSGWTSTIGDKVAGKVMYLNYEAFEPLGIHPLLRTQVIDNSGPGQYFYQDGGFTSGSQFLSPSKAWIFQTNADPDDGGTNAIWTQYIKTGITIGYAEQLLAAQGQNGVVVHDPLSWEWWRELMDLSRGTSYIATYYADLTNSSIANNFFNQTFFQHFADSYAGTNNTADEASSPGAWVAFAPSTSPFGGNLSLFMNETASSNTQGYDSNKGANILGAGQPYGRYATEIKPGGSITLSVDTKVQTGGAATLNIWYYDSGSGSWSISAGGSSSQTVTKSNSGAWKVASFTSSAIPSSITLNVPSGSSTGTYFHMVEVVKSSN